MHRSTRFGTEELARIEATLRSIEVISGSSEAWYRARFGTGRSRVRIPPSRPLTQPRAAADSGLVHHKSPRTSRRRLDLARLRAPAPSITPQKTTASKRI